MSEQESFSFDYKKTKDKVIELSKNKKVQWGLTIILLLVIIFMSSSIRFSNWDLLVDQTTGEKIPLALDPFYFLRLSETIVEQGNLGEVDSMRYPSVKVGYSNEIMPQVVVWMYKVSNVFGEFTLREVNVASPVIFFMIGLVFFFFLVYSLTKSKGIAIISTTFIAFVPAYLYRTMAGFSDHESIGMMAFFAAMLVYSIGLNYIYKKKDWSYSLGFGLLSGFLTMITIVSWGGVSKFLFIIFSLSFIIVWLSNSREGNINLLKRGLIFYSVWIISTPIYAILFRNTIRGVIEGSLLTTNGLISLAVFGFILIDFYIIKNIENLKFINKKYREFYSIAGLIVLGVIGLTLIGRNIFSMIKELWITIFHPWGVGRVGLTVAENSQPYLVDWISQTGTILFWIFFAGVVILGFNISKKFSKKKSSIFFILGWTILVSSILFSRISPSSLLQGTNIFSQIIYIGGVFISIILFIKIYIEDKPEIKPGMAMIIAWVLFTLVSGRSAQRVFFAIAPVVCFIAAYAIFNLFYYFKKNKDEIFKPLIGILLILVIIGGAYSVYSSEKIISIQAESTGPSANPQWQNSMSWVRENTSPDSIFIHWWDYGYWVQTLGKRATITDGGHYTDYWDHLIGRYLLTTPNSNTAYSLMKTHQVDYLLIDPSDIGKYPAYSIIGSDGAGRDRYSSIPLIALDQSQSRDTGNTSVYVYSGGVYLDEDLVYNLNGENIFLPEQKAAFAGVIWTRESTLEGNSFSQPMGVYYHNNKRFDIPIRYAYTNERLLDYGSGIEAVIRTIPVFDGKSINELSSIIYISPKVAKGLFAQVYLLNDSFGNYKGIKLVNKQDDNLVSLIKSQGFEVGDFIVYGSLRGPLNIYKIEYPEDIISHEEFLKTSGEYAEFDNLNFVD